MEAKRSYIPRMETEVLKKARGETDVGTLWTKQSVDKGSYRVGSM